MVQALPRCCTLTTLRTLRCILCLKLSRARSLNVILSKRPFSGCHVLSRTFHFIFGYGYHCVHPHLCPIPTPSELISVAERQAWICQVDAASYSSRILQAVGCCHCQCRTHSWDPQNPDTFEMEQNVRLVVLEHLRNQLSVHVLNIDLLKVLVQHHDSFIQLLLS
jgi:hypothetical protein